MVLSAVKLTISLSNKVFDSFLCFPLQPSDNEFNKNGIYRWLLPKKKMIWIYSEYPLLCLWSNVLHDSQWLCML